MALFLPIFVYRYLHCMLLHTVLLWSVSAMSFVPYVHEFLLGIPRTGVTPQGCGLILVCGLAQQEVSGTNQDHLPTLVHGKIVYHETSPRCHKVDDCYSREFTEAIKSITQSVVIITPCWVFLTTTLNTVSKGERYPVLYLRILKICFKISIFCNGNMLDL